MASAKGIAITAAIVVGVIGASMLVWFGPQGEPNAANSGRDVTADNINSFRNDEAFGSIYTRHQNLGAEVEFEYDKWKAGDVDSSQMLRTVADAKADVAEMIGALAAARPPEEWQASFGHYGGALDSYSSYLDEMDMIVRASDRNPDEANLDTYRQNSEEQVELAASAIPVSPVSFN
ncbi:hypothetical protein [Nitrososphaera sp.]|uniref:hypothetical protein n=1 Tax=Nitrososphaera sp. TaxID=1971748 RepID=UPI002EDA8D86